MQCRHAPCVSQFFRPIVQIKNWEKLCEYWVNGEFVFGEDSSMVEEGEINDLEYSRLKLCLYTPYLTRVKKY